MNTTSDAQKKSSIEIFTALNPEIQNILREVMQIERAVMHMQRRADVHLKICEVIRRNIK